MSFAFGVYSIAYVVALVAAAAAIFARRDL